MRAVETLDSQELVHEIATIKLAAATESDMPPVSSARLAALLAESKRRRGAMQRPAPRPALTGPLRLGTTPAFPAVDAKQAAKGPGQGY